MFYDFKNGLNKGKEFFGSGTPIVNFTDVFHNRRIYSKNLLGTVNLTENEISRFKVKKGDLFFTRTSETINQIGYPSVLIDETKDTVFSGFLLRGRAIKKDPLADTFKSYVFFTESFRREMITKSSMTTRALTTGSALKGMSFNFPKNCSEQCRIGDLLINLDQVIELHQRKIQILQRIKRLYLQEMLANTEQHHPNLRFNIFEDNWKTYKLKEVIVNEFKGKANANMSGTESIYLDTNYLNGGEVSFVDSSSNIAEDDVIILWDGSQAGTVYHGFRGALGSTLKAFTPRYSGSFIYLQLLKNQNRIYHNYRTPNIPHVIKTFSEDFLIPMASQNEQNKISTFLNKLEYDIKLQKEELDTLVKIKEEYLNKMFI